MYFKEKLFYDAAHLAIVIGCFTSVYNALLILKEDKTTSNAFKFFIV